MEPEDNDFEQRHLRAPAERSFISLLGGLRDDCLTLGKQKLKLVKLQLTNRADRIRKYATITSAGAVTALIGLIILMIGISHWAALLFGQASIPIAAGHTMVGVILTVAGGTVALLASRKLPRGAMLPSSALTDVIEETEDVAENVVDPDANSHDRRYN